MSTTAIETSILPTMSKGEAQVRAIFEAPGLNNKEVARLVRAVHPGCGAGDTGEKTVAWYRAKAKKVVEGTDPSALGKNLGAVALSYGRPVPSAAGLGGSTRPAAPAMTPEAMAEHLRSLGFACEAPAPDTTEDEVAAAILGGGK